ncbi:hypothetical protein [Burkholderia sp. TSV86]|uniref:hypothetical protein n=1 Tax=Burkholderia sp. TSV86 TaxID=1385594 RepID=UPI000A6E4DA6|nr:hypothetical protein [Burkholderia sp. TSV86]
MNKALMSMFAKPVSLILATGIFHAAHADPSTPGTVEWWNNTAYQIKITKTSSNSCITYSGPSTFTIPRRRTHKIDITINPCSIGQAKISWSFRLYWNDHTFGSGDGTPLSKTGKVTYTRTSGAPQGWGKETKVVISAPFRSPIFTVSCDGRNSPDTHDCEKGIKTDVVKVRIGLVPPMAIMPR